MNKGLLLLLFICRSLIALQAQIDLSNNKTDNVQQRIIGGINSHQVPGN